VVEHADALMALRDQVRDRGVNALLTVDPDGAEPRGVVIASDERHRHPRVDSARSRRQATIDPDV
jgi:hypothetical protein